MCAGAEVNARIKEIFFGAFDPVKGALGSVTNLYSFDFPNKPEVFSGIKEKESALILH
jgi:tRNA(adenine34) deaminase